MRYYTERFVYTRFDIMILITVLKEKFKIITREKQRKANLNSNKSFRRKKLVMKWENRPWWYKIVSICIFVPIVGRKSKYEYEGLYVCTSTFYCISL